MIAHNIPTAPRHNGALEYQYADKDGNVYHAKRALASNFRHIYEERKAAEIESLQAFGCFTITHTKNSPVRTSEKIL